MDQLSDLLTAVRTHLEKLCELLACEPSSFAPQVSAAIGGGSFNDAWADHSVRLVRHGEARIGAAVANVERQFALLRLQRMDLLIGLQTAAAPLLQVAGDRRGAMRAALLLAEDRAPSFFERNRQQYLSTMGIPVVTPSTDSRRRGEQVQSIIAQLPRDAGDARNQLAPVQLRCTLALRRLAKLHPEIAATFTLPGAAPERPAPITRKKKTAKKPVAKKKSQPRKKSTASSGKKSAKKSTSSKTKAKATPAKKKRPKAARRK